MEMAQLRIVTHRPSTRSLTIIYPPCLTQYITIISSIDLHQGYMDPLHFLVGLLLIKNMRKEIQTSARTIEAPLHCDSVILSSPQHALSIFTS